MKEESKYALTLFIGVVIGAVLFMATTQLQEEKMLDKDLVLYRVEQFLYFTDESPATWRAYVNENMTLAQVRGYYELVPMARPMIMEELSSWCGLR